MATYDRFDRLCEPEAAGAALSDPLLSSSTCALETLLGEQVLLLPVWVEDESSAPAHALWRQHKLMERESYSARPVWFPKEGGLLGVRRGCGERVGQGRNSYPQTTKGLRPFAMSHSIPSYSRSCSKPRILSARAAPTLGLQSNAVAARG